jgi:hypothetical protein
MSYVVIVFCSILIHANAIHYATLTGHSIQPPTKYIFDALGVIELAVKMPFKQMRLLSRQVKTIIYYPVGLQPNKNHFYWRESECSDSDLPIWAMS